MNKTYCFIFVKTSVQILILNQGYVFNGTFKSYHSTTTNRCIFLLVTFISEMETIYEIDSTLDEH